MQEQNRLDPFLLMELPWLKEHFKKVWIVAADCIFSDDEIIDEGVISSKTSILKATCCFLTLFSKTFLQEFRQLRREKQWEFRFWIRLFAFAVRGQRMKELAEKVLRRIGICDADCVFYSCWMSYDGYAAALCKQLHPQAYSVARGHAFDIDIERNELNPYLMKRFMAMQLDRICPISNLAKSQIMEYAMDYMPPEKLTVVPFGSKGDKVQVRTKAPYFKNGVLHVITCAQVLPIKQVGLLADALDGWDGPPVHWIHVGGGEGLCELQNKMDKISAHSESLICECRGCLTPDELDALYQNTDFDVFINSSKNEGVPVTVMEAMRYSIPVIAPKVGGLPEIVDASNGILFQPNSADDLKRAIQAFIQMPSEKIAGMRAAAQRTWQERYQNRVQLPKLFNVYDNGEDEV